MVLFPGGPKGTASLLIGERRQDDVAIEPRSGSLQ